MDGYCWHPPSQSCRLTRPTSPAPPEASTSGPSSTPPVCQAEQAGVRTEIQSEWAWSGPQGAGQSQPQGSDGPTTGQTDRSQAANLLPVYSQGRGKVEGAEAVLGRAMAGGLRVLGES